MLACFFALFFWMWFSRSLISAQHTEYKRNERSTIAGFSFPLRLASAGEVEGKNTGRRSEINLICQNKTITIASCIYPERYYTAVCGGQTERFTCKVPPTPVQREQLFKAFKSIHWYPKSTLMSRSFRGICPLWFCPWVNYALSEMTAPHNTIILIRI